jgi:GNAT superfamily N-acetyltransferase
VGLDRTAFESLRQMILADGARPLAVSDLCDDDLAGLSWSGNPAHLRSVAAALQRAAQGREDYLVVWAPGGQPVAKMRVDYTSEADTGVFWQLAVMGPLQGLGIATMLIGVGEQRARTRGLAFAALGVEDNNPRACRAVPGACDAVPARRTCSTAAQPSAGCAVLGVERASGPRRRVRRAKGDRR